MKRKRWGQLRISAPVILTALLIISTSLIHSRFLSQTRKDEIPFSLEVNVDMVVLNATVVDDHETYISGLKKEDFQLFEDEEPQDISVFMPVETPFQLVLMIDNSNSTKGDLGLIKKAASNFVNELRPEDRISIIEINYFVHRLNDLTSSRKSLYQEISRLSTYPYGGSRIYDGLAEGINYLSRTPPGRKAMVLLSDNMENSSALRFEDLRTLFARNDMVLYSVTIENQESQKNKLEKYIKNPKAPEPLVSNAIKSSVGP